MKRIFLRLTVLLLFAFTMLGAQNTPLHLQSGTIFTTENLSAFIQGQEPEDVVDGYYYRVIQFNSLPDESTKSRMQKEGLLLMDYLPKNSFITAIPYRYNRTGLTSFGVRSVVTLLPVQKISRYILGAFPEFCRNQKGYADITLQYHANIQNTRALNLASTFGKVLATRPENHVIDLRIPENSLYLLATQDWLLYVSAIAAPSQPEDTKGRSLHRSNVIDSEFATGRHYDGSGVTAAVADDGFVGPHIDFTGRLFNYATGSGQNHGDMTSGILGGAGNLDPTIRGMATGAFLYVYNIGNYPHVVNAVNNYNTIGTVITSTSYSQGCNDYTTDTQFGDNLLNANPQLSFVFSGGNNQSADCGYGAGAGWGNITGGYKQGKNVIACGNLSPLEVLDGTSSRGPASDGRIKPDICSNGRDQLSTDENNTYQVGGGTSAACPGIAGILAQLYQAHKELNGGAEPQAALIKACLLNSAEDIGNPGPDFTYGWGRVNTLRALQTLEENRYIHDSLVNGQTKTHQINVPAGVSEMRVMVYWNDTAGSPIAAYQLVNDLNISIDDGSTTHLPWKLNSTATVAAITSPATQGIDSLNNMEQVSIVNPAAGVYTLTVNGFNIPSSVQDYYVVYEFRTNDITVTYPFGGEAFVPGTQEVLRWDAKKGLGPFILEYSTDNGTSWNTISSSINQNILQFTWNVPAALNSTEALVRVSRGGFSDVSDTSIRILPVPQGLAVNWVCVDSVQLSWNAIPGVSSYTVYQLGSKYMDPVAVSNTNSCVLTNVSGNDEHWFAVSANVNGFNGRRCLAIRQAPGLVNCPLAVDTRIASVNSPATGTINDCRDNSAIGITITFENAGQNPVSNIPVNYQINSGPVITETISTTINPGTQQTFTFNTTANLSSTGNYAISVWTSYPGDLNAFNDTVKNQVNVVQGTLKQLPVTEGFDNYTLCSTASNCGVTVCNTGNVWLNAMNGSEDEIDFRVISGATPSAGTGPTNDHTLANAAGKYIYLEASGGCTNRTAVYTASCIDLTNSTQAQLSYWYHMYGATMGSLSVDIYSDNVWNLNVVPALSGDQGDQWIQNIIPLNAYAGKIIDVRFRAITGNDFTSDLALDDITISETVGLQQTQSGSSIKVYPNPSAGIFRIDNLISIETKLEVVDIAGRIVNYYGLKQNGKGSYTIDLSKSGKGLYFLRIKNEKSSEIIKITVM